MTLDKDFGELAVLHGAAHCGILRLVGISAGNRHRSVSKFWRHGPELVSGAIITAEAGRLGIRLP